VDDIADIDLSDAGDAIDRRGEIGVAEIDPRAFDDRLPLERLSPQKVAL
jgi:hypothetical protein